MYTDDELNELRSQLPAYLRSLGCTLNGKLFRCIFDDHEDKTPSMEFKPRQNRVMCYGCHRGGDIFDVIGHKYGISNFNDQVAKARELVGSSSFSSFKAKQAPVPVRQPAAVADDEKTIARRVDILERAKQAGIGDDGYFEQRRIPADVLAEFNIGIIDDYHHPRWQPWRGQRVAIIPTGGTSFTARALNPKGKDPRYLKDGEARLFNEQALTSEEFVIIVEGEIDALSVIATGRPAVALSSVSNWELIVDKYRNGTAKAFPIIALDPDSAGIRATEQLSGALRGIGVPHYAEPADKLWGAVDGVKDANDLLCHNGELTLDMYLDQLKFRADSTYDDTPEYRRKNSMWGAFEQFSESIMTVQPDPLSTGLASVDTVLDGGLYPKRLYVVGAIASAGKTAITMQIADNIARAGRDVLIFSLEMDRFELMARSISRITYEMCIEDGIRGDEVDALASHSNAVQYKLNGNRTERQEQRIIEASKRYFDEYSRNIFIQDSSAGVGRFTVNDIVKTAREHTEKCGGNAPVIIVDYLQIISPHDVRATEKQSTDYAIKQLKTLANTLETPVVVVSALNRQSGDGAVHLSSFKESGGIEYGADVCLGLYFEAQAGEDINKYKRQPVRDLRMTMLKNRAGATGDTFRLKHRAKFNHFRDDGFDLAK